MAAKWPRPALLQPDRLPPREAPNRQAPNPELVGKLSFTRPADVNG